MTSEERSARRKVIKRASKRIGLSERYIAEVIRRGAPCEHTARMIAPHVGIDVAQLLYGERHERKIQKAARRRAETVAAASAGSRGDIL